MTCNFFYKDTAATEIYTLSLHDALPILATIWLSGNVVRWIRWSEERLVKIPAADFHQPLDRKSTRLNSSHVKISYAVFCLKKKKWKKRQRRGNPAGSEVGTPVQQRPFRA